MKSSLILAALLALSGCAAQVLSTSPRTVVIQAQRGIAEAQPLAEAECNKQGRHARYDRTDRVMTHLVFDCVL